MMEFEQATLNLMRAVGFVLLSALVFFAWGEIYSLFPTT
jgi:hypothetical protein